MNRIIEVLKLQDVVSLPLLKEDYGIGGITIVDACGVRVNFENLDPETANLFCDAFNNYDRLTDENAKLKELAMYCSGFLGCEDTRDSMALHSITTMAKEILNKDTK